jgi:hypothetical protein
MANASPINYFRTCPACGRSSAVYHDTCPACGQCLGRWSAAVAAGPPPGWRAEFQNDGRWRITQVGNRKFALLFMAALFVYGVFAAPSVFERGSTLSGQDAVIMTLLSSLIVLLMLSIWGVLLAWVLSGREEWTVGPDLLLIRRELFGRSWEHRHQSAKLVITRWWQWDDFMISRTCFLQVKSIGMQDGLVSGLWSDREARSLGAFLSGITGWPLNDYGTL